MSIADRLALIAGEISATDRDLHLRDLSIIERATDDIQRAILVRRTQLVAAQNADPSGVKRCVHPIEYRSWTDMEPYGPPNEHRVRLHYQCHLCMVHADTLTAADSPMADKVREFLRDTQ